MIPDMIHPLGKYWKQPDREDIIIDDTHALMNKYSFHSLHEYRTSIPTGVYAGKMWKTIVNGNWFLMWFSISIDPDSCDINRREIILV